jgi:phosphate transport system substrate-binding protein
MPRPLIAVFILIFVSSASCARRERLNVDESARPVGPEPTELAGAGASLPSALYQELARGYELVDQDVRIEYQSIGSDEGIALIQEGSVDFAATSVPMTDEELSRSATPVAHFPVALGGVVLTYNLPRPPPGGLRLTADVVAGIYLGHIRRWNDPRIVRLNRGWRAPRSLITVTYRADESGMTGVFSSYLAAVSPTWRRNVGAGRTLQFPQGMAALGNEGMASLVRNTSGAIGYVGLAYAKKRNLPQAILRNRAGNFVEPSIETLVAAASSKSLPEDLRLSIVNAPGEHAYPIASFNYLLVSVDPGSSKTRSLRGFLSWSLDEGQRFAPPLNYAPLPPVVASRVEARLSILDEHARIEPR